MVHDKTAFPHSNSSLHISTLKKRIKRVFSFEREKTWHGTNSEHNWISFQWVLEINGSLFSWLVHIDTLTTPFHKIAFASFGNFAWVMEINVDVFIASWDCRHGLHNKVEEKLADGAFERRSFKNSDVQMFLMGLFELWVTWAHLFGKISSEGGFDLPEFSFESFSAIETFNTMTTTASEHA